MTDLHAEIARAEVRAEQMLKNLDELIEGFMDKGEEEIWRGAPRDWVRDLLTLAILRRKAQETP